MLFTVVAFLAIGIAANTWAFQWFGEDGAVLTTLALLLPVGVSAAKAVCQRDPVHNLVLRLQSSTYVGIVAVFGAWAAAYQSGMHDLRDDVVRASELQAIVARDSAFRRVKYRPQLPNPKDSPAFSGVVDTKGDLVKFRILRDAVCPNASDLITVDARGDGDMDRVNE